MAVTETAVTLSEILYKHRGKLTLFPTISLNSTCPTALMRSPKAPDTNIPKFSIIANVAAAILNEKVSALFIDAANMIYVEQEGSSERYAFLYDVPHNTIYVDNNRKWLATPYFLSAFTVYKKEYAYTFAATETFAKSKSPETLAGVCDCFYYDAKDVVELYDAKTAVMPLNSSQLEQVQLSINNGVATPIETPFGHLKTDFLFVKFHDTKPAAQAVNSTEIYNQAKEEKFVIGFDWNEEQQAQIPALSMLDNFIPNPTYRKLLTLTYKRSQRVIDRIISGSSYSDAIQDDYINAIISGRPGTGKTTTVNALAASLGLPIYVAKVTKNTEEDAFEGLTKVNASGGFSVYDTAFLKAFRDGGIILLEEFNLADPGVLQGALGQAIEKPFILTKDGYEEIHRHPLCIVIATMNTGTQGAREPNQAFSSRLPVTLTMNDPSDEDFLSILCSHGYDMKDCQSVYTAYKHIINYLKEVANSEDIALCVTMRHCLAALSLLADEVVTNVKEAVYDTMIGSIGLRDMELAEDVYANAIVPKRL